MSRFTPSFLRGKPSNNHEEGRIERGKMKLVKRVVGLAVFATLLSNNPAMLGTWTASVKHVVTSVTGTNLTANSVAPLQGRPSNLVGYVGATPLLWRTCKPVEVLINNAGEASYEAIIVKALNRASEVSGVNFKVIGTTEKTPVYDWYKQGGTPPVIIGVVNQSDLLNNADALGSTVANPSGQSIVTGAIALKLSYFASHNDEERYQLTLHEIGHLIGLKHVDDASDLMYPAVNADIKTDFSDTEIQFLNKNKSCGRK